MTKRNGDDPQELDFDNDRGSIPDYSSSGGYVCASSGRFIHRPRRMADHPLRGVEEQKKKRR